MIEFRQRIGQGMPWLVLALAFFLPLSTSVVTVIAILLVSCWLLEGRFGEKWNEVATHPLCLAVLLYVVLLVLGLAWSEDLANGVGVIKKHWKIMMVPILLTAVRWEWRSRTIAAFVAGVAVVMALNLLDRFHLLPYFGIDTPEQMTLLVNHIIYTPMLSLAAYFVAHAILWGAEAGRWRWWLVALAGSLSCTVFVTKGRAGQLAFFVLLCLLLFQYFQRNRWRAVLLTLIASGIIFTTAYSFSPQFQTRMDEIQQQIATVESNPETSVGRRLTWWKNSWEIVKQSPWFGVGTGDFDSAYKAVHQRRTPHVFLADNPHNQYLYAAIRLGTLGLVGLLGMFAAQLYLASRIDDGWQRMRTAFPLFFLTIMLTDSYLVSHGSGFLFSLFCAVLYKMPPGRSQVAGSLPPGTRKKYWLILSYRVNIPGSACSQHIDDRLALLEQAGITPILLSGPIGERYQGRLHYRAWSLAPSGIRLELRHYLRRRLPHRWQFYVADVLLFPLLPLYLLEKIVINLESEWSWFAGAAARGWWLQRRYRPEVLYSTSGSASAHLAALFLAKKSSVTWIAEIQDPLVHEDWSRSQKVLRLYRWLERRIARGCDAFVFLTRQAMENARSRAEGPLPGVVIYPGAAARRPEKGYVKGEVCRFAHFGSLAGSRNLLVFFAAWHQLLLSRPQEGRLVRLDIYGSFDPASRQSMEKLGLESLVTYHGLVDRHLALRAMETADCLLLIQNISLFSSETIPSKVYEYFASGRPILGLIHRNDELKVMLQDQGHFIAQADEVEAVKDVVQEILTVHRTTSFCRESDTPPPYTTERAVRQLAALAERNRHADLSPGAIGAMEGEQAHG